MQGSWKREVWPLTQFQRPSRRGGRRADCVGLENTWTPAGDVHSCSDSGSSVSPNVSKETSPSLMCCGGASGPRRQGHVKETRGKARHCTRAGHRLVSSSHRNQKMGGGPQGRTPAAAPLGSASGAEGADTLSRGPWTLPRDPRTSVKSTQTTSKSRASR